MTVVTETKVFKPDLNETLKELEKEAIAKGFALNVMYDELEHLGVKIDLKYKCWLCCALLVYSQIKASDISQTKDFKSTLSKRGFFKDLQELCQYEKLVRWDSIPRIVKDAGYMDSSTEEKFKNIENILEKKLPSINQETPKEDLLKLIYEIAKEVNTDKL